MPSAASSTLISSGVEGLPRFGRLKQFRGPATRYAKRVAYYRTEVVIAAIALWLRDSQDTS